MNQLAIKFFFQHDEVKEDGRSKESGEPQPKRPYGNFLFNLFFVTFITPSETNNGSMQIS